LSGALEPVFIRGWLATKHEELFTPASFPIGISDRASRLVHDVPCAAGWVGALEQIEQYFERAPFCVVRVFGFVHIEAHFTRAGDSGGLSRI